MSKSTVLAALALACAFTAGVIDDAHAQGRYDNRGHNGRQDQRNWRGNERNSRGGNAITIYEHANFQGRSQTFSRPVTNLQMVGMNDITSSIQVRGEWLVCEHANFEGRCEIVGNAVRNLQDARMNDQISSLRPATRRDYRR